MLPELDVNDRNLVRSLLSDDNPSVGEQRSHVVLDIEDPTEATTEPARKMNWKIVFIAAVITIILKIIERWTDFEIVTIILSAIQITVFLHMF